jgi:hypothetical protein
VGKHFKTIAVSVNIGEAIGSSDTQVLVMKVMPKLLGELVVVMYINFNTLDKINVLFVFANSAVIGLDGEEINTEEHPYLVSCFSTACSEIATGTGALIQNRKTLLHLPVASNKSPTFR